MDYGGFNRGSNHDEKKEPDERPLYQPLEDDTQPNFIPMPKKGGDQLWIRKVTKGSAFSGIVLHIKFLSKNLTKIDNYSSCWRQSTFVTLLAMLARDWRRFDGRPELGFGTVRFSGRRGFWPFLAPKSKSISPSILFKTASNGTLTKFTHSDFSVFIRFRSNLRTKNERIGQRVREAAPGRHSD